jgi:pimeloyl-ACP methyl ester carboxylesterase
MGGGRQSQGDHAVKTETPAPVPKIEALLSSRLFLAPQLAGDRLYFISNLSGKFSLYAMDRTGSVPEPLLPPTIAVQNPELMEGESFALFPRLDLIVLMLDRDGDEVYQPVVVPMDGGVPHPLVDGLPQGSRNYLTRADREKNIAYVASAHADRPLYEVHQIDVSTRTMTKLAESMYGSFPAGYSADHTKVALIDGYGTMGDTVLYLWHRSSGERQLLAGVPLDQRGSQDAAPPPTALNVCEFIPDGESILTTTALFDDAGTPALIRADPFGSIEPVSVSGTFHSGSGELERLDRAGDRYLLTYNIDGATWVYECTFDPSGPELRVERVVCGTPPLNHGVAECISYDAESDSYALSFSTATSPTQLYVIGRQDITARRVTRERILGIPDSWLSHGEAASYTSFDGLRISARLYLPATGLGYAPPHPLVYYIHGGPQSQERPNFAWFSMPMIQFLALNGFAVFVPNVRGSTGYGLNYARLVDHDWGGDDVRDHVHAMLVLAADERVDTGRAGVMGRSYGGFMTLTLTSRHPELWTAAVDMFGPYDMLTFLDRIPETWKPITRLQIGDPETELDFLVERSPSTHLDRLRCPLLVVQGRNDPRVTEGESRLLVERLQREGKKVEFLVFENEGHDVLRFENRVRCYNEITEFFRQHLA